MNSPRVCDEWEVLVPRGSDPFIEQASHGAETIFQDDLQRPGILDAQSRADEERQPCDEQDDQQDHHDVGRYHVVAREVIAHRLARPANQGAEQGIHELHNPQGVLEFLHRKSRLLHKDADAFDRHRRDNRGGSRQQRYRVQAQTHNHNVRHKTE
jgi:hypothetical protein